MTRRAQPETQIQRAVIEHLAWRARPCVWWTHIPLGGLRSKVEAAILRGLGTARGTPDLLIVADGKAHFLERTHAMTRYPQDRASVLATTLISIVVRHLRAPEVHAEIAQTLREEFHDIARQARDETRPSGE